MAAALPPVVYLDTSDWSRFGDVVRGRGDDEAAALYAELAEMADRQDAIFAYSAPILSELLQYDPAHAATTVAKAEAVERLCGRNAMIWPARLIALEIARAGAGMGWNCRPALAPLSRESDCFPAVEDALSDLRGSFDRQIEETAAMGAHLNRAARRKVQARARRVNILHISNAVVPELAAMYGFSENDVRRSIIAVLEGRVTPVEGSRRLFSAIARPTAFVQTYFVRGDGEKDLPSWLSDIGIKVAASLEQSRASLASLEIDDFGRRTLARLTADTVAGVGQSLVRFGREYVGEFGLGAVQADRIANDPEALALIPCWRVFTGYLGRFITTNLGIEGDRRGHRPERSSAGDMIHAWYLPHCDIWRGDRRFAHLLRTEVPEFADRIATRLSEVPAMVTATPR